MAKKSEAEQCAMFLYLIGEEGRDVFDNMIFADAEKDKIEPLFEKFKHYCNPKQQCYR